MGEQPVTAAALVRFSSELESRLETFYQELAERFPSHRATFAGLARDCAKNGAQVMRTYQETVTDALETGFSFAGLSLQAYQVDLTVPEGTDLATAVQTARALQARIAAFYEDVAERCASLLATIPRTFKRVARTHAQHRETLGTLGG